MSVQVVEGLTWGVGGSGFTSPSLVAGDKADLDVLHLDVGIGLQRNSRRRGAAVRNGLRRKGKMRRATRVFAVN
jgi:hypothetical protein